MMILERRGGNAWARIRNAEKDTSECCLHMEPLRTNEEEKKTKKYHRNIDSVQEKTHGINYDGSH